MNERLARINTFRADLIPDEVEALAPDEPLPTHSRVIRPLLALATECVVYDLRKDSPLLDRCADILRPARGKHALDLTREVVVGYEPLWNATGFERGSIVALVPVAAFDPAVFRYARRFYVIDNPNVSHTPTAIRHCREAARAGLFAFSITKHSSRSVQVYGPPKALQALYAALPKSKRRN